MKKIITICILSILSLPVYADTMEEKKLSSNETEPLIVFHKNTNENTEAEENIIINKIIKKEKNNKFVRAKGYFGLPGELQGYYSAAPGEKTRLLDIEEGLEGMIEGVYRANENFELAMGLGAQIIGALNTTYGIQNNYYAIPLYFSFKYNVLKSPIYLKSVAGVTFNIGTDDLKYYVAKNLDPALKITENDIKVDNGSYLALGMGVDIWKMELEALYSVNRLSTSFTADGKNYYSKFENARITVGASYAFDWNIK